MFFFGTKTQSVFGSPRKVFTFRDAETESFVHAGNFVSVRSQAFFFLQVQRQKRKRPLRSSAFSNAQKARLFGMPENCKFSVHITSQNAFFGLRLSHEKFRFSAEPKMLKHFCAFREKSLTRS